MKIPARISALQLLFILILSAAKGYGQISPKIYVDPSDLPNMIKREMIVATMDEDPKEVKRLEKNLKKKPEGVNEYRKEIADFNANIKSGIEKYWKLNSKYEYKSMTDVKALMEIEKKNKSSKYMVLMPGYLSDTEQDVMVRSDLTVPVLIYQRAEITTRKPDYKIYLPNSKLREGMSWAESDIHFALVAMQGNLNYMIKKQKKYEFDDYLNDVVKENCTKGKGKTILIDKNLIEPKIKDAEAKIKEKYKGDFKIVDYNEINQAFAEGRKNTVVMMCIPYGLLKGSFLIVNSSYLITGKITVDCETHEIINEHEWVHSGMGLMGKTLSALIQPRNVVGIAECSK
jgi:hypothetical protein